MRWLGAEFSGCLTRRAADTVMTFVRRHPMHLLLVLISLSAIQPSSQARPWENDPVTADAPAAVVWARQTTDGDRFWIRRDELEQSGKWLSLWLHGDHRLNGTVKYRSSLWRISFSCSGTYHVVASSTFDASGRQVSSWDGFGQSIHVRPGTIYQDIEKQFCP